MMKEFHECLLCGRTLQQAMTWKTLLTNKLSTPVCQRCFAKFELVTEQPAATIVCHYHYNAAMKDFLHRYKFAGDVLLAHVFRAQIAQALKGSKAVVVPIPMHPENKKQRTFSHIDELLLAARIPFQHVLTKTTTATQVGKTRQQRIEVAQLFTVTTTNIPQKIVLIDDIYTTGTTIAHAKRALQQAGAEEVTAWTLIRG